MATDIAPPLPEKSKLRARKISTPDVIPSPPPPSLHASSSPTVPDNNNNNNNNNSSSSSSSSNAPSLEKKIKSRFTEHFDHIPPPELLEELAETDFHVPTVRKPQSQKTAGTLSKTLRPFLQTSNSATTLNINAGSDIVLTPSASSPNRSNVDNKRPPLSSSSFWPRSLSSRNLGNQTSDEEAAAVLPSHSEDEEKSVKKKTFFGAAGRKKGSKEKEKDKENKEAIAEDANAVSSTSTSNNNKSNVIQSLFSLNRAEVIITRLENWHHVLKSISGWLEEVAKVSFQNSRCYSQRALPLVKNDNGSEGHHHRDAIATMQTGLQMLTMQLAAEQKEFGKRIQHDFLPGLLKLRKECKEMIRGLKEEPELVMDELLRRAETTRKSMAALNKCCKAAESAQHTIDDDPWLANLYVLRQLKREVDEENRMRELMVPIQKGTAAFEARAIEHLKQAIEFCYTRLSPAMWDGTTGEDSDTPPYKLVLRHIMPDYEWERFFESKKKDLVNPENPRKDYLRINYPNKLNPVVMTLAKGVLERRAGLRKQFVERYFVLSQCGYFYEFAMSDKVSPERSIYIPDTTIVPSIDISHLAAHESAAENPAQGYTFEIHKRGTQMLHRDKTYVYRAQSREELLSWCRLLCEVAARGSRGGPPIKHILAPSGGGGGGPHHCPPSMPRSVSSSLSFTTTDRPNNGSTVSVPTVRAPSVASVKPIDKDQVPTSVNRRREPSTPETHTPTSATNKIPAAATDEASVQELDVASEEPKLRAKQQEDHDSDDENNKHADANIEEQPPTTPTVTQKMDESENLKTLDADDAASILTARPDAEQVERPESRASTHFTDTESSVYFSSRSADPSPNGSVASLTAPPLIEQFAIPELENERNPAPQAGGYFYSPKLSSPMPWKADEA